MTILSDDRTENLRVLPDSMPMDTGGRSPEMNMAVFIAGVLASHDIIHVSMNEDVGIGCDDLTLSIKVIAWCLRKFDFTSVAEGDFAGPHL